MSHKILVLNCYRQTLTIIRSLSAAGHEVVLGVADDLADQEFVHFSRHVSSTWLHPNMADEPLEFDKALREFLERGRSPRLIFPVGETAMRRLARIRSDLPDDVTLLMPTNEVIEACLDKPMAYRIAAESGVPVPRFLVVSSPEQLMPAVEELGYPSIIKARDSRTHVLNRKCLFVRTAEDLVPLVDQWPEEDAEYIVQVEVQGPRYNCDIVAQDGEIRLYLESEIIRTDRYDYSGISVLDRSIPPDERHQEFCRQFISALGFTGIALIQFLHDRHTGQEYFLEANPRPGATIALAVHCGIDLPAAAVNAHLGEPIEPRADYPHGQLRSSLDGSLVGIRRELKLGEISITQAVKWFFAACRDCLRADCHATFSVDDPRPTLKLFRDLFVRLLPGH